MLVAVDLRDMGAHAPNPSLIVRRAVVYAHQGTFPLAWSAIEAALAVAGYRLLRAEPSSARSKSLAIWGWNVLMIGGWSRLFFKRHKLGISAVAAAGLLATSAAFVKEAKEVDKTASRAGLPLVGWVAFATVLTATVWRLNARKSR